MEAFEYTKLATSERYNELYNFFLSEYLSLNKEEEQSNNVEQSDTQSIQSDDVIQPQSEDPLLDDNNAINDNFDPFNDENIEL